MKNRIKKLHKKIPLKTRLYVSNEMMLITALVDLGFIEDRSWTDSAEDDELLLKINKIALDHTEHQLKQIEKWEEDGRP